MKKKKDLKEKENDNDKTQRDKTQRDKLEISIADSITSNPKPILYYNKVKESICYGEFCEYIIFCYEFVYGLLVCEDREFFILKE